MAKKKPTVIVEQPKLAVQPDAMDDYIFSTVRDVKAIDELCEDIPAEGLVQDSFTSFFSRQPQKAEKAPRLQSELIDQMMQLPEYRNLHASSHDDEISSALSTKQFAPQLIEQYRMVKEKEEQKKKEQGDQQGQQQEGDGDGEGEGYGLSDLLSDEEMSDLRQQMREALNDAQDDADKWENASKAWGLNKGELKEMPVDRRMELAETMIDNDKLNRISELVGRFRNIVNSKASTAPVHGNDEIVDIRLSDDINHMLPTEYVKFITNPEQFYVDLVEKKLMTYELKGVEEVGKGPIIACLDISGSMSGQREEWSKAVVLALVQLAQKQKRAFGFLAFESCISNVKFFAKGQKISLEEKMKIASISTTGGTDFYPAIMKAFDLRSREPSLKPADIIFITDGDCFMSESQHTEINKLRETTEVRIYSIAIEGNGDTLKKFSDQVARVDMNGDVVLDVVKDLIGKTASGQGRKQQKAKT